MVCAVCLASPGFATTISYHATADDGFTMYISTSPTVQGTSIGSGNDWSGTFSGSGALIAGVTNYLQVYGDNSGGNVGGFIGDFTLSDANFQFGNGAQSMLTNAADWFVSETGYNAAPNVATDRGQNGAYPWGIISGIDAQARWIWTTDSEGSVAYLSIPITYVVPLPPALLLLGSGLLALAGWRKLF